MRRASYSIREVLFWCRSVSDASGVGRSISDRHERGESAGYLDPYNSGAERQPPNLGLSRGRYNLANVTTVVSSSTIALCIQLSIAHDMICMIQNTQHDAAGA